MPRPNLDPFAGVLDDVGIASPRKGNDVIEGGDAADDLWGRGGADDLDGGAGRDFIFGGTGQDRCVNGEDVSPARSSPPRSGPVSRRGRLHAALELVKVVADRPEQHLACAGCGVSGKDL